MLSVEALHTAPAQHRGAGEDGRDGERRETARRARVQEQLRRQLVRLNESTLMIDAQLVEALPATAGHEAQQLFDAELALSNCARFARRSAVSPAARTSGCPRGPR